MNSSAFESAVDRSIVEKPVGTEQEEQIDSAAKEAQELAVESAIEKEWKEIKIQNEQDRSVLMDTRNQPMQTAEHPL